LGKEIAKKKKNASRTVTALQAEIAKEQAAIRQDKSDGGSEEEQVSSSDEEETELLVDSVPAVNQPTTSASKVCALRLALWPSIEYLASVRCSYQVRPDVRAQKSKV
jgi:hypothetical protein